MKQLAIMAAITMALSTSPVLADSSISQKYVFDYNDMTENIEKYVVSDDKFGGGMVCGIMAQVFLKETLNAFKSKDEVFEFFQLEAPTPTTIEVFKDKIVWDDLGHESKINDNMISLPGFNGEALELELIKNEENINFKNIPEGEETSCLIPFKKAAPSGTE